MAGHGNNSTDVVQEEDKEPPIDKWFSLIHKHMVPRAKRDDMSSCLSEVIESIGSEEGEEEETQNLYAFISGCLASKCPSRELSVQECAILFALLEHLRSSVLPEKTEENDNSAGERDFLSGGSWWWDEVGKNGNDEGDDDESGGEIHNNTINNNNNININKKSKKNPSPLMQSTEATAATTIITSAKVTSTSDKSSSSSRSSSYNRSSKSIGDESVEQFLTSCLNYPKIKKISLCLNPLQVPVSLLNHRHKLLFHQQQEHQHNNQVQQQQQHQLPVQQQQEQQESR